MKHPNPADLRAEFWRLPGHAYVDRATAAAAGFCSVRNFELLATRGEGPPYVRAGGRGRAMYRVADVAAWLNGRATEADRCEPAIA